MSLILNPQKSFSVVRQIANHIDTTEYYVRAVIRYAYTDALITNLDLDLKGDQRYSKNWQVVADPSGQGTYISIVTSVYTDAGHTTKSENYGDEENTYRVFDDMSPAMKGGGGLDMRTTRRIMEESLEKMKFPEQEKISIPKQKEYDDKFNELTRGLSDIKTLVASIPTENVNLSPVVSRLNELSQELKTKPVTKETDLNPVLRKVEEVGRFAKTSEDSVKEALTSGVFNEMINKLSDFFENGMTDKLNEIISKTSFNIGQSNATLNVDKKTEPKKEEVPFNIKSLAK